MATPTFRRDVQDLYARLGNNRIEPFIGAAFDTPRPRPRMVILGVNAYVDAEDWSKVGTGSVGWFAGWYGPTGPQLHQGREGTTLLAQLGRATSST